MKRLLVTIALTWIAVVTVLHLWLNLGTFSVRPGSRQDGPAFRVGFLPVT